MGNPREDELIERLRRTYEAFNRGDFDTAIELAHPDVVFVRPGAQAELRGAEAFRAWMEPDAFESQMIEPLEFRVSGNNVLVRQHATARGAGSGIEIDIESMTLWTFDDDAKATRVEFFLPHQEAEALTALPAQH
jgi:ketosteroid isomerase-like protein